jgi:glucose-1-phosphate thymidylyltransferase
VCRVNIIVPVGGLGKRLRPHTWSRPKPLVSVAGKPVLGHVLDRLSRLPLERAVFVTGYLGEQIEAYVRATYRFDSVFVEQAKPLGQSHALAQAKGTVAGPTLVVFPDMLFEADLDQFQSLSHDGALFVKEVENPRQYGVVVMDGDQVTELVEKPEDPVSNQAVVGIYYFKQIEDLFSAIDHQMAEGLTQGGEYYIADAIQHLIDQGGSYTTIPVSVWEDCGSPDQLLSTNRYLLDRLANDATPAKNLIGCVVRPPVVIDPTARIRNSVVGPYASIGAHVEIDNSIVQDSIVDEDAHIERAMLTESIVGRSGYVRGHFVSVNVGDSSDVILAERGRIGDYVAP